MPRTVYQQFVSDFAAENKGKIPGHNMITAAAEAWSASGLKKVGAKKAPSGCVKVSQPKCLPPKCKWVSGDKRKYCRVASIKPQAGGWW
jgi:hypothetical protein